MIIIDFFSQYMLYSFLHVTAGVEPSSCSGARAMCGERVH